MYQHNSALRPLGIIGFATEATTGQRAGMPRRNAPVCKGTKEVARIDEWQAPPVIWVIDGAGAMK
jgi:hypothetical protein